MMSYGCDGKGIPEGIDRWICGCPPISYYNQTWVDQGKIVNTGDKPNEYTPSLVGNYSLDWLKSIENENKPFFAYLGVKAPHGPATPADWYLDHPVGSIPAPRDTPYYNYSALDHHDLLANQPILDEKDAAGIDTEYSKRLRSLVAVDDIIF